MNCCMGSLDLYLFGVYFDCLEHNVSVHDEISEIKNEIMPMLDDLEELIEQDKRVYNKLHITSSDLFETAEVKSSEVSRVYDLGKRYINLTLKTSPYLLKRICKEKPEVINRIFTEIAGEKVELNFNDSFKMYGSGKEKDEFDFLPCIEKDRVVTLITEVIDDKYEKKYGDIVNEGIWDLNFLSFRAKRCLSTEKIFRLKDLIRLIEYPDRDTLLNNMRNCGEKTAKEIIEKTEEFIKNL